MRQLGGGIELLWYLDAVVRQSPGPTGFDGCLCVGVRSPAGLMWWVAELGKSVTTRFSAERPAQFDVAIGVDVTGARSLLGLEPASEGLQLVSGQRSLLKRFVQRYLRGQTPSANLWGGVTRERAQ